MDSNQAMLCGKIIEASLSGQLQTEADRQIFIQQHKALTQDDSSDDSASASAIAMNNNVPSIQQPPPPPLLFANPIPNPSTVNYYCHPEPILQPQRFTSPPGMNFGLLPNLPVANPPLNDFMQPSSLLQNPSFLMSLMAASQPPTLSALSESPVQGNRWSPVEFGTSSSSSSSRAAVKRRWFEDYGETRPNPANEESSDIDMSALQEFSKMFKEFRVKNGFTRHDITVALEKKFDTIFSPTTVLRFEACKISIENMRKLHGMIEKLMADGQSIEKVKRPKTFISSEQRQELLALFNKKRSPDEGQKIALANRLGLKLKVVSSWFSNRRNKVKKNERPIETEASVSPSVENWVPKEECQDYGEGTSQQ